MPNLTKGASGQLLKVPGVSLARSCGSSPKGTCPRPSVAEYTPSVDPGNRCLEVGYEEDTDCDGVDDVTLGSLPGQSRPAAYLVTLAGLTTSGCCTNKGGAYYESISYDAPGINGSWAVSETDSELDGPFNPYSRRIVLPNGGKFFIHNGYTGGYEISPNNVGGRTHTDQDDPPCVVTPHDDYETTSVDMDVEIEIRLDSSATLGSYPSVQVWLRSNHNTASGNPHYGTGHDPILLFESSMCLCCDGIRSRANWLAGQAFGAIGGTLLCQYTGSDEQVCICDDATYLAYGFAKWVFEAGGTMTWAPI